MCHILSQNEVEIRRNSNILINSNKFKYKLTFSHLLPATYVATVAVELRLDASDTCLDTNPLIEPEAL